MNAPLTTVVPRSAAGESRVRMLKQLERKLLWLSSWMIHNANHIRPNRDGLKVGGHQDVYKRQARGTPYGAFRCSGPCSRAPHGRTAMSIFWSSSCPVRSPV